MRPHIWKEPQGPYAEQQLRAIRRMDEWHAEQRHLNELYERQYQGDQEAAAELAAYWEQGAADSKAEYEAAMPARLQWRGQMVEEVRTAFQLAVDLDWHKSNAALSRLEKAVRALRMGDQALVEYERGQGLDSVRQYLMYHLPKPAGWIPPHESESGHWEPPQPDRPGTPSLTPAQPEMEQLSLDDPEGAA